MVQINVTVEKGGEVCPPREEPSLLSFVAALITHYDRLFISLSCLFLSIVCFVIGKVTDNICKLLEKSLLGLAFVMGNEVSRGVTTSSSKLYKEAAQYIYHIYLRKKNFA